MQLLPLLALSSALATPEIDPARRPEVDPETISALANALLIDEPGDGRTWARAATWKASFGPEGLAFTPFFGSDAPRNYPLSIDLARVTIDGEALPLAARARDRQKRAVTLDRGTLREVYHLDERHVEQTFVFDDLAARGEIVLDLDVETELTARPRGAGFSFDSDLGSVEYGGATAIDASGARCDLHQELTDSGLRIVVPADFVAAAALPLTIDPILSTYSFTSNTRRQVDLDVSYAGPDEIYQIVFSELQSANDSDVLNLFFDEENGTIFPVSSLDITSADWRLPRCAFSYEARQFLCVAVVGSSVGSRRVWGRTRESNIPLSGVQFPISGFGAEYVDVGGKGNAVATIYDYMVVWHEADTLNQDFDIVAQAVNSDSTLTQGRITIAGDPDDLDRYPAISKSSGRFADNVDSEYMIVWERELAGDNADIHAQVIEYTGSRTGHSPFRAYSFSEARRPDVSSRDTRFGFFDEDPFWVIPFERRTGDNFDLFAVVARDGGADNARSIPRMQDYDDGLNFFRPQVAFDGSDYLVAYATDGGPGGAYPVHYTAMSVVRENDELRVALSERRQRIGTSMEFPRVAAASLWDGGGILLPSERNKQLVVWLDRPTVTTSDVRGAATLAGGPYLSLGAQYCDANANSGGTSAWMAAYGTSQRPGATFWLECTQMPQNSFGHFLCSLNSGFVANPAGSAGNLCLQGGIGRLNRPGEILNSGDEGKILLFDVDTQALPSPLGTVSAMSGEFWYFTTWFRDVGSTSNFSNAIEVFFL
ncbi:MAG: hypothetical protein AAF726_12125 [Planctomycetota bacterium]